MAINENQTEVLNDLIRINNDRIEGYIKAADEAEIDDADLKAIFYRMADESRQYVSELSREVVKLGGEPASGATIPGKIYRAWMDVKATFTGHDRKAVLSSCEHGEDVAQKAYKEALEGDETLAMDLRQLIANQKASLKISHDTIKKYRDAEGDTTSSSLKSSDNLRSSDNLSASSRAAGLTDTDDVSSSGNLSGSGNLRNNI